jgi:hypothetical protein
VSEREIKRQASNQSTKKSPFAEKMESAQGRTTRSGFCARLNHLFEEGVNLVACLFKNG